ncbi:MAG: hypothetical protein M1268_03845 [Patescibacteria group bacterium]|nr:hypothetical protein [Patescibacteria group bacterium]
MKKGGEFLVPNLLKSKIRSRVGENLASKPVIAGSRIGVYTLSAENFKEWDGISVIDPDLGLVQFAGDAVMVLRQSEKKKGLLFGTRKTFISLGIPLAGKEKQIYSLDFKQQGDTVYAYSIGNGQEKEAFRKIKLSADVLRAFRDLLGLPLSPKTR